MLLFFFGLLISPLWKSFQVVYYYWQDDNRVLAQRWIRENLPADSPLAVDGYAPRLDEFPLLALEYDRPAEFYHQQAHFVSTSSLDGDRFFSIITHRTNEPEGRNFLDIQQRFRLIKEFDLGYPDQASKENGSYHFPDFQDPLIRIYSTRAGEIRKPGLFSQTCGRFPRKIQPFLYQLWRLRKRNHPFFTPPRGMAKRILRSSKPLNQVLLILSNGREG